jgi:phenylalanyl-tRNA synthetase beta chain
MKVTFNWLQNYVNLAGLSGDEVTQALTMAGLEVEAVMPIGRELESLVVGEVLEVQKHPQADRLTLCKITTGGEPLDIVCGAPNVRAGILVPVALPGTRLPSGMKIRLATIRNVVSHGMLCSEKELGLSGDHSGIMILPETVAVGQPLSRALGLEDTLMEVNVTPNRGDCLSHIGIAREISALFDRPLSLPDVSAAPTGKAIEEVTSVSILAPDYCPRYSARLIRGVTIGPSPLWLRQRLHSVGIRSINNVVDVTNFVMMEYGQPLHAFDFDTLAGRRIVVRTALPNERMTTLDGQERDLTPEMLVIADGEKGVALAGVMGGLETEIQASTKNILLESACFEPRCIRRTAKKLSLSSEASTRFERGVDIDGVLKANDRAALLIQDLAGGEIVPGWIDQYPRPLTIEPICLNTAKTARFLGIEVSTERVLSISYGLGFGAEVKGKNLVEIIPPSFRRDLTRPVDLMEEVARMIGYDRIPATIPNIASQSGKPPQALAVFKKIQEILNGLGFDEIITYSFISEGLSSLFLAPRSSAETPLVRINNPISEDQSVMRVSLIPGMLMTMEKNWAQRNLNLRLFELGKVFSASTDMKTLPVETNHLSILWTGRRFPESHYFKADPVDFFDLKGVLEDLFEGLNIENYSLLPASPPPYFAPEKYVRIEGQGEPIGEMGEISPLARSLFDLKETAFLIDLNLDLLILKALDIPLFKPWPRFPEITRDMALIIAENILWKEIKEEILSLQEPLIEGIELFDLYHGKPIPEGKKNMGVRIHYRSPEKTLSDEGVNAIHDRLLKRVLEKFGAILREK